MVVVVVVVDNICKYFIKIGIFYDRDNILITIRSIYISNDNKNISYKKIYFSSLFLKNKFVIKISKHKKNYSIYKKNPILKTNKILTYNDNSLRYNQIKMYQT